MTSIIRSIPGPSWIKTALTVIDITYTHAIWGDCTLYNWQCPAYEMVRPGQRGGTKPRILNFPSKYQDNRGSEQAGPPALDSLYKPDINAGL
jgi:hypothetical protein